MRTNAATRTVIPTVIVFLATPIATAQSLFEQVQPRQLPDRGREVSIEPTDGTPGLGQISLYVVEPPEPRTFLENDLITIIISERARTDRTQELETEKSYEIDGEVTSSLDLLSLLEGRLQQGRDADDDLPVLSGGIETEFEGEADYVRDDSVTARVTARVLEVKPNGNLVLEARTVVRTDEEEQVILVSGTARTDDVTNNNSIQSNQLYDLRIDMQHTGEVKKGASKGIVTKVLDTIFNF